MGLNQRARDAAQAARLAREQQACLPKAPDPRVEAAKARAWDFVAEWFRAMGEEPPDITFVGWLNDDGGGHVYSVGVRSVKWKLEGYEYRADFINSVSQMYVYICIPNGRHDGSWFVARTSAEIGEAIALDSKQGRRERGRERRRRNRGYLG